MKALLFSIFSLLILSGCATPIDKTLLVPNYSGKVPESIAVAVVDKRPYVVSGNKKEWFEGIVRGAFGIPMSLERPGENKGKPFAHFLSLMIKSSLEKAGSKVSIIQVPKGASFETMVEKIREAKTDSGMAVTMRQSRYDAGLDADYAYDFDVAILRKNGETISHESFTQPAQIVPLSDKYNLFDMYAQIYKEKFEMFINNQKIKQGLFEASMR